MSIDLARRRFIQQLLIIGGGCTLPNVALGDSKDVISPTQQINIKTLGAIGDGVTDDSDVIDLALKKLFQNGGTLFFPTGIYLITRSLSYNVMSNSIIVGDEATIKFVGNITGYCWSLSGIKKQQPKLQMNLSPDLTRPKPKIKSSKNSAMLVVEGLHLFKSIDFELQKLDEFNFLVSTSNAFFTSGMIGKNLVNSQNGITFLIMAIKSNTSALVVPGNNQAKLLDLSSYHEWAIVDLWCKSRGYYLKGEFVRYMTTLPSAKKKVNVLYDNYQRDCSFVWQVMSGTLSINGINLQTEESDLGLAINNLIDVKLEKISINGFKTNSLLVKESLDIKLSDIIINGQISHGASNYSCCFNSCQDIKISTSHFWGGFHALSFGGTFPCRNIELSKIKLGGSQNWSLDFHGNCQLIKMKNIASENGIYLGGIDSEIVDSKININSDNLAALVLGAERNCNNYKVVNCEIENLSGNALVMASQFVVDKFRQVTFLANKINAPQKTAILLQAYPFGNNPKIEQLIIQHNLIFQSKKQFINLDNHNKFVIINSNSQF